MPHFSLLACAAPLCFSHTHHASARSTWLFSALLHTHVPSLASPCLIHLRSASLTCKVPHFTVLGWSLLCVPRMRPAPLHPACLLSSLHLSHAPRLASPCLLVLLSAPLTCAVLHFTLIRCAVPLCSPHTHHASLLPAWLCCSSLLLTHTHTPSLASLCLAVPRSASLTCPVPRFPMLG